MFAETSDVMMEDETSSHSLYQIRGLFFFFFAQKACNQAKGGGGGGGLCTEKQLKHARFVQNILEDLQGITKEQHPLKRWNYSKGS
jgi:hypothetical protein